ncbi:MAG: acetyl/propionyl/methylcrotonyl-CoA carboxylase subunit alpha [Proteobacteria bacterium]|nr:acetyl/propionyl/methylcrotonyl-CoA carboxylase subunit alpha [Pseudomonadota bacterium]
MFDKILIANRGEIACRVMDTARRLGVATVAVYSDADAHARHVAMADEAHAIGPAPPLESYLRGDAIIAVALACGASAIHPGYGFLAENAGFARACAAAGVVFIGPKPETIEVMGDKARAKSLVEQAGVPVIPGYDGGQDQAAMAEAAGDMGLPILIKPVAGGGGKGMRLVEAMDDFIAALEGARREARSAFGDDRVMLEKYLERSRHIEVQVFGDGQGNVVHLFERDCSIQRRHQKIIEEAPAIGLSEAARNALTEAACAAARAAGYVGAGTVEFLVDGDGAFYFLEMNTRLQVEHPVTEMITGVDLVEWQLRIAAGEPLPLAQEDITARGHAIEARLCAEDPARDFLPSTGTVYRFRTGPEHADTRLDSGLREGDAVSPHYDPMIAKLVVRGADRGQAIDRMGKLLAEVQIAGVASNAAFLAAIMRHPEFSRGALDTGFVGRELETLAPPPAPAPDRALAIAAGHCMASRASAPPWGRVDGWRLNLPARQDLVFLDGGVERRVTLFGDRIEVDGRTHDRRLAEGDAAVCEGEVTVFLDGASYRLRVRGRLSRAVDEAAPGGHLTAPMPGRVVAVTVEAGARVTRGQTLMVIEAMKMEHGIAAPADGVVERVNYEVGDSVEEGVEVIVLSADTEGI